MKIKKNWKTCDICGKNQVEMIESLNYWKINDHICWCKECWKVHEKANELFNKKWEESQKRDIKEEAE